MKNLWNTIDKEQGAELVDILVEEKHVLVERIVSAGESTDWQASSKAEYVILVQGTSTIAFPNGDEVVLQSGDTLLIPAGVKHCVKETSADPMCIWICVHYEQEGACGVHNRR